MVIYLIRHGRQASKLCNINVGLSAEGISQAQLLGQRLQHERIERIYSSHLIRAVETAAEINRYLDVEQIINPDFREISFGDMEGKTDQAIASEYHDFKRQQSLMETDLAYPGGESAGDVIRRVIPLLESVVTAGNESVVIVTHGGVIRSLVAYCLGLDLAKIRMFGNNLENSSITELVYQPTTKRFLLERFNDYAHLEVFPHLLRRSWVDAEN